MHLSVISARLLSLSPRAGAPLRQMLPDLRRGDYIRKTQVAGHTSILKKNFEGQHAKSKLILTEDVALQNMILHVDSIMSAVDTPSTHSEAILSMLAHRWREFSSNEIEDLLQHDTWKLTYREDKPKRCNLARSKWVC